MRKNLMSLMLLLFSKVGQELNTRRHMWRDITHIKAKLLYLNAIKTFRFLFLSMIGIGAALVFLLVSLMTFNTTVFSFVPMAMETKMWVGFGLSAFYMLIAAAAFSHIFLESKWVGMFHAEKLLKDLDKEATEAQAGNEASNANETVGAGRS